MKSTAAFVAAAFAASAFAQDKPAAAPPPPGSRAGRPRRPSPRCIPFAPHLTGRPASELPLDKLKVPAGFKVEVWAEGIPEARSLALGDKGTVFVSNRNLTERLRGRRQGRQARGQDDRSRARIAQRHRVQQGHALRRRAPQHHALRRHRGQARQPAGAEVVVDNLDPTSRPATSGSTWRWGPTASSTSTSARRATSCMPTYDAGVDHARRSRRGRAGDVRARRAQLRRLRLASRRPRNCGSPTMRATGSATTCRTTRCTACREARAMNFGYPFCHQGDLLDPEFGKGRSCNEFDAGREARRPHRAAGHAVLHRQDVPGRIPQQHLHRHARLVEPHHQAGLQRDARRASTRRARRKLEPFLEGFLTDAKADPPMWGRPVDLLVMKDGSLLVSDDYNGIIYRVSYGK